MKNLVKFIDDNADWKNILAKEPYNIAIKPAPYNKDWYMFSYNLFSSDFTNPIVKECRGCCLEIKDNKVSEILCYPYDKFFNYGDPNCAVIDWSSAKAEDKIDGMLLKVFKHNDMCIALTNGSWNPKGLPVDNITAESLLIQAFNDCTVNFYNEMMVVNSLDSNHWTNKIPNGCTIMIELTSPYNRVICKYDKIKLWFHGFRDEKYVECDPEEIKSMYNIPYDIPKSIPVNNSEQVLEMAKKLDGRYEEGFVVCDKNFNRIKLKCDDYLRIKTYLGEEGITDSRIFKLILDSETDDLLEFDPTLIDKINDIKNKISFVKKIFADINIYAITLLHNLGSKKEYALMVKNTKASNIWFEVLKEGDFFERFIKKNGICKDLYSKFLDLENFAKEFIYKKSM